MKLTEKFEVHDTLNPKLFNADYSLKSDVREKLLEIADDFTSDLILPIAVVDVQLVGSNASFNYTQYSDVDLHLIANFDAVLYSDMSKEELQNIYLLQKTKYNNKYEITIKDISVEIYVEDMTTSAVSNGIYSVKSDKWIKFPKKIVLDKDIDVSREFEIWKKYIEKSIEKEGKSEKALNDIYLIRKNSIAVDGEYGKGNILFKDLRNAGLLDKLRDQISKEKAKELSLESLKESYTSKVDSAGNELSDEQVTFFKDSKIRDKNGNLLICYHGTQKPGFEEFDARKGKSQFGDYKFSSYNVNYFTTNKDVAVGYTKIGVEESGNVYACYLNITNPYIVNNKTEDDMYKAWKDIKDESIRKKELAYFNKIYEKWWANTPGLTEDDLDSINDDLFYFNHKIVHNEDRPEYYDLVDLGNNTMYGASHSVMPQYELDEFFDEDQYEELRDHLVGNFEEYEDDYFYTIDNLIKWVLLMNKEDNTNYDGIIIPDISDIGPQGSIFTGRTTDIVTLKSSNQIKRISNVSPTSSNNINETIMLDEAKADIDAFVNKFGQDTYDLFIKSKDRLKNNKLSTDITYHTKNTTPEEMTNMLQSLQQKVSGNTDKSQVDFSKKQIPGKYKYWGKFGKYEVYEPLDAKSSMALGVNTGWCTTGRYGHAEEPNFKPSLKDAQQHWNDYENDGERLVYLLDSKTMYGEIAIDILPKPYVRSFKDETGAGKKFIDYILYNKQDDEDENLIKEIPIELQQKLNIADKNKIKYEYKYDSPITILNNQIEDITLLSVEEAEKLPKEILSYSNWWWLRSPGDDSNRAAGVYDDGSILDGGCDVRLRDRAVRPALITNLDSSNFKQYKSQIRFGNKNWLYIGDNMWLLNDEPLTRVAFNADPTKGNKYEGSDVYNYIRDWLSNQKSKNESLFYLTEATRTQLLDKSKNSVKGRQRLARKNKSKVSSSTREFNKIDMNKLFKDGILTVDISVRGETDNYSVRISFGGFLDILRNELKRKNDILDLQVIVRALKNGFDRDDVYVGCNCPDFYYRFGYVATKNKYNSIEPQLIPANIRNPHDTLGSACKHTLLVLSNNSWIIKCASVINNYINYMKNNYQKLYADVIYPAIYGKKYDADVQMRLDDTEDGTLDTSTSAIDKANVHQGRDERGRFSKGNTSGVRFSQEEKDDDNTIQLT